MTYKKYTLKNPILFYKIFKASNYLQVAQHFSLKNKTIWPYHTSYRESLIKVILFPRIYPINNYDLSDFCPKICPGILCLCVHTCPGFLCLCVHTCPGFLCLCVHTCPEIRCLCVHTCPGILCLCVHTCPGFLCLCVHTCPGILCLCVHTSPGHHFQNYGGKDQCIYM